MIRVFDPAMGLDHLKGEKQVLVGNNEPDSTQISIHPWVRDYRSWWGGGIDRSVGVRVGYFEGDGEDQYGDDGEPDSYLAIVNREDFVEAILSVFPELKRVDE